MLPFKTKKNNYILKRIEARSQRDICTPTFTAMNSIAIQ